jgi:hypothetical protein
MNHYIFTLAWKHKFPSAGGREGGARSVVQSSDGCREWLSSNYLNNITAPHH